MDRLPKFLLHRIMSLLSYSEAVRFGVTSRKYYSVWRSFPILEFDFDGKRHCNLEIFYRLIYKKLRNRPDNFVERLSIRSHLNSMFNPLGPDLLFLAASCNLRELELTNTDIDVRDNHKDGRHYSIVLPGSIFHLSTLTVLKLDCFRFETPNIVLDRLCTLKKLRLARTLGIHSLTLKENTSLESLEIDSCEELQLVDIDAQNLEHFDFLGPFSMHKCEVAISPDTTALKTLRLKHANVSKSLFQETTTISQVVENLLLKMSKTMELKWIQLDWSNLKKVEFMGMLRLEKIDLLSENLDSCVLDMAWSPTCEINFQKQCGRFLTSLSLLYSEKITGAWIEQNLDLFTLLENFRVEGCAKLKWVKFTHGKIKNLKLLYCNSLDKVDIDTPYLESLELGYNDKIPSYVVIRSKPLRVKLSLFFRMSKPVPHEDLNRFLSNFNSSKELTLHFKSNFDRMFPPKRREDVTSITPLYDVKILKIDFRFDEDPKHRLDISTFGNLLKGLFWLVPLPKCLTFITSMEEHIIKFEYGDFEDDQEASSCCFYYPEQCWKHRLVSVRLSNFDSTDEKSIAKKRELVNFLKENASRLKTIHDDCAIDESSKAADRNGSCH